MFCGLNLSTVSSFLFTGLYICFACWLILLVRHWTSFVFFFATGISCYIKRSIGFQILECIFVTEFYVALWKPILHWCLFLAYRHNPKFCCQVFQSSAGNVGSTLHLQGSQPSSNLGNIKRGVLCQWTNKIILSNQMVNHLLYLLKQNGLMAN